MKDISLKTLLEAGCHFGHQTVRWNPKMRPYIFEAREGVHIFDLVKTKEGLIEAANYLKDLVSQGGRVLFVGTKRQAREIVEKAAKEAGMPYVTVRWLGGIITNFDQIKKSLKKMADLKQGKIDGTFSKYTKKENLLIDREIARLEHFFGGLAGMDSLPEAVLVIDAKNENNAVREASRLGLKIVGLVDTNSDPDLIDYVIPANDDAVKSIELIINYLTEAIKEGQKEKAQNEKKKEEKEKKAVKVKEKDKKETVKMVKKGK